MATSSFYALLISIILPAPASTAVSAQPKLSTALASIAHDEVVLIELQGALDVKLTATRASATAASSARCPSTMLRCTDSSSVHTLSISIHGFPDFAPIRTDVHVAFPYLYARI